MPLADENDEWHVEKVLEAVKDSGKQYYLVKWHSWPEAYNTWEPEEHLGHAESLLSDYWAQKKRRRGRGR
jgi:hypothetical protein